MLYHNDLRPNLSSLASNSYVKESDVRLPVPTREASDAVKRLLESTFSVAVFKLRARFKNGDEFRPIAQGLINSQSVTDIHFDRCEFDDEGCTLLFKSVLQSKPNIRSLCVHGCGFPIR
jgi:hypothetical protein